MENNDYHIEKEKNVEKFLKYTGILVGIFLFVILIVIKSQSPSFPIIWIFVIGGLILVLSLGLFFGVGIYRKLEDAKNTKILEGKLPKPITIDEATEFIKDKLLSPIYADHVNGWKQHRIYEVGKEEKNKILLVHLEPTAYNKNENQFILINLNFPDTNWSYIIQEEYNPGELTRTMNTMVRHQKDEPNTKITEEENPLTGIKRKITESLRREIRKEENKDLE